jgi:hypothetical protein
MRDPFLKDSIELASIIPEYMLPVDIAASIIKEGNQSVLVIMLLIARFIEAFFATLTSKVVISIIIAQFVYTTIICVRKPAP